MLPAVVRALHVACNACCLVEICGFHPQCMFNTAWVIPPELKAELTPLHLSSHSLVLDCSRRSDSGVQREIREQEKKRWWRRRRREREEKRVPSLSPLPHPLAVFFWSHLFTPTPRSERLEQVSLVYLAFLFTSLGSI